MGVSDLSCNVDDVDHHNPPHQVFNENADSIQRQKSVQSSEPDSFNETRSTQSSEQLANILGLDDPEYQSKFNKRTVEIFD